MCRAMEEMRDQAAEEAAVEQKKAAARRMLSDGTLPLEKIAEYEELSLDEVKALQATLKS